MRNLSQYSFSQQIFVEHIWEMFPFNNANCYLQFSFKTKIIKWMGIDGESWWFICLGNMRGRKNLETWVDQRYAGKCLTPSSLEEKQNKNSYCQPIQNSTPTWNSFQKIKAKYFQTKRKNQKYKPTHTQKIQAFLNVRRTKINILIKNRLYERTKKAYLTY